MAGQPPKKPGGFSLYGDLLNQSAGTITGAPVKYEMKPTETSGDASAAAQKKKDAALKFQPIKRPQANAGGRGRGGKGWNATSSSGGHKFSSSTVEGSVSASSPAQQREQPASTFENWVGNEEEEFFLDSRKQQPRGRKKQKGHKRKYSEEQEVDWDAIYDPSKPTVIARYKGSTEQDAERREWKEYLYRQAAKNGSRSEGRVEKRKPKNTMFAPPSGLNFAPPSFDDPKSMRGEPMDVDDEDDYGPPAFSGQRPSYAPPPAPANVPDDATGEDAYARRMHMSGVQPAQSDPAPRPPPQAQPFSASSSPAPPVAAAPPTTKPQFNMTEAQAKVAAFKAKFEASRPQPGTAPAASYPTPPAPAPAPPTIPTPPPPADDTSTLTRAPVRYNLSNAQLDALSPPASFTEAPSRAPGKKDFGARMMAKMGWEKGQGLGAQGEGITTPLVAQASKRKKRSDQDGGGWAAPRSMGKIVGGKKKPVQSTADDDGTFGAMSDVVKLSGMLEGLNVAYEIEENNLLQEIGEEFGQKYGSIERLFVWREEIGGSGEVFVKFTSQLSALRAVNATDGMTFAGNPVVARFFDGEKFDQGEYA